MKTLKTTAIINKTTDLFTSKIRQCLNDQDKTKINALDWIVYDPSQPDTEDDLKRFVEMFPKALRIKPNFCLCFINHHNSDG